MVRNGLNSEPGTGGSVASAGGGVGAVDGVKAHRGVWILKAFGGILNPEKPLIPFWEGFWTLRGLWLCLRGDFEP